MSFLKNLFGKSKDNTSASKQKEPELEPIVMQAIEHLYPDLSDRKQAFTYSLKFRKERFTESRLLLALLSFSNGDIKKLEWASVGEFHFIVDDIHPIFPTMEAAENWVKSMTESQD